MVLGSVFEKANQNVHRARNIQNIPEEVADTVRTVHLYLNPGLEGSGSLIKDDILYNPRQIQVYLPWLEPS